jgi:hypothetical protein
VVIVVFMLTPLTLCVISRILRLNRSRDFGAILRLMSGPVVKLNPRNFRSCGRATALFEIRGRFHALIPTRDRLAIAMRAGALVARVTRTEGTVSSA